LAELRLLNLRDGTWLERLDAILGNILALAEAKVVVSDARSWTENVDYPESEDGWRAAGTSSVYREEFYLVADNLKKICLPYCGPYVASPLKPLVTGEERVRYLVWAWAEIEKEHAALLEKVTALSLDRTPEEEFLAPPVDEVALEKLTREVHDLLERVGLMVDCGRRAAETAAVEHGEEETAKKFGAALAKFELDSEACEAREKEFSVSLLWSARPKFYSLGHDNVWESLQRLERVQRELDNYRSSVEEKIAEKERNVESLKEMPVKAPKALNRHITRKSSGGAVTVEMAFPSAPVPSLRVTLGDLQRKFGKNR
jgi:hypothetical protein